jgi:hypothetical protein
MPLNGAEVKELLALLDACTREQLCAVIEACEMRLELMAHRALDNHFGKNGVL